MRSLAIASSILLFTTSTCAQTGSTPSSSTDSIARLPVTRVILYKNGIGYFEHAGHVRGNQQVNVDFTTAQLNDVLKSLTVADESGGRIAGVRYDSIETLDQRLDRYPFKIGSQERLSTFLDNIKGAHIELKAGERTMSGAILRSTHHPGRP